ncbi:Kunitz-type trypsin inhibitor 1 protein [Spatholobus suberectus]|nr:Kunitz-type trypsin inhibitor 1 protein [Spatholobus suberectus]
MKPAILLTLYFLLFAFTTSLPLAFSQGAEQVLNRNGNPLFAACRYYILPPIFSVAGVGVRLSETGNSTCAVTVLQYCSEVANGLASEISHTRKSTSVISIGLPLDIAFGENPECATSTEWVVFVDDFLRDWLAEFSEGTNVIKGQLPSFCLEDRVEQLTNGSSLGRLRQQKKLLVRKRVYQAASPFLLP